ncbi:hypothetical protein CRYUN_Cryun06bG0129300 [Craigia yunnanensis]
MNPLCCIAPVSIDDRSNPVISKSGPQCQLSIETSIRTVNYSSKPSFSSQVSSINAETDKSSPSVRNHASATLFDEPIIGEVTAVHGVAGILYKWVNYGRGWRSRWFVLEDGVLSYYKVSSIRASKSDDKRLTIFTGTKTLHLHCLSREDRTAWIEALLAAKDLFPRVLSSNDFQPFVDVVISTDKLRSRLLQEGIGEAAIKDCESIMLLELSEMQNQLKTLQRKHIMLLDTLRQLETVKIELETTVVDETKEHESYCGQGRRFSDFYSVMSEGNATDSDVDNESQDGADVETDEDDGIYFDTNDFLSSEALRSASYRCRETGNGCIYDKDGFFSDSLCGPEKEIGSFNILMTKGGKTCQNQRRKRSHLACGLLSRTILERIYLGSVFLCILMSHSLHCRNASRIWSILTWLIEPWNGESRSVIVNMLQENDLMRILNVAAFAVSGYASTEGRQCKPFNPLLGETYEADYPDKGLRFFSEKVSHHPMIVACHCEGRGWKFWADSNLKGKFWGQSIQLDPVGVLTLQFEDGETFQWSKVTTSIYNIILGKIYCDHYGTMRIRGSGNYSCKLKFKEQSIIDRNPHQAFASIPEI